MKLFTPIAALGVALLISPALHAQQTVGSDTNTLKVLRETLAEQQRHPDKIIRTPTNAAPDATSAKAAAAAELERQYLEGKLTARQYQQVLADLERGKKVPAPATPPTKGALKPQPAADPATPAPTPKQTEKQKAVSDVESRIDAIFKEKEARDRAAQTNAPAAPGPKATKRERLDFLLKQVVAGKLSDEEYKKEREKILAEAD